jgi:hypothetical protein
LGQANRRIAGLFLRYGQSAAAAAAGACPWFVSKLGWTKAGSAGCMDLGTGTLGSGGRDLATWRARVFHRARRLLSEKCPMVLCEMHSEQNRSMLVENLSQLGYRCFHCDERHVLAVPQMTSAA